MIYALLDCSNTVSPEHLRAALALWSYCERSAYWIFGTATGDVNADKVLAALQDAACIGLTRTEILEKVLQRNVPSAELSKTLQLLHDSGRACYQTEKTATKPVERWFAQSEQHEFYEFSQAAASPEPTTTTNNSYNSLTRSDTTELDGNPSLGGEIGDCSGMTNPDCQCKSCEDLRRAKAVYPSNDRPEWVRLFPSEKYGHWQAALKEALSKPCAICGEQMGSEPYVWFNIKTRLANCIDCRETAWWLEGYEIEEGLPWCWDHEHTREQRIIERDSHFLREMHRDLARRMAMPEAKAWLDTPEGKAWRTEFQWTPDWEANAERELLKRHGADMVARVKALEECEYITI